LNGNATIPVIRLSTQTEGGENQEDEKKALAILDHLIFASKISKTNQMALISVT
jgi:hypothetical protein